MEANLWPLLQRFPERGSLPALFLCNHSFLEPSLTRYKPVVETYSSFSETKLLIVICLLCTSCMVLQVYTTIADKVSSRVDLRRDVVEKDACL